MAPTQKMLHFFKLLKENFLKINFLACTFRSAPYDSQEAYEAAKVTRLMKNIMKRLLKTRNGLLQKFCSKEYTDIMLCLITTSSCLSSYLTAYFNEVFILLKMRKISDTNSTEAN